MGGRSSINTFCPKKTNSRIKHFKLKKKTWQEPILQWTRRRGRQFGVSYCKFFNWLPDKSLLFAHNVNKFKLKVIDPF